MIQNHLSNSTHCQVLYLQNLTGDAQPFPSHRGLMAKAFYSAHFLAGCSCGSRWSGCSSADHLRQLREPTPRSIRRWWHCSTYYNIGQERGNLQKPPKQTSFKLSPEIASSSWGRQTEGSVVVELLVFRCLRRIGRRSNLRSRAISRARGHPRGLQKGLYHGNSVGIGTSMVSLS